MKEKQSNIPVNVIVMSFKWTIAPTINYYNIANVS